MSWNQLTVFHISRIFPVLLTICALIHAGTRIRLPTSQFKQIMHSQSKTVGLFVGLRSKLTKQYQSFSPQTNEFHALNTLLFLLFDNPSLESLCKHIFGVALNTPYPPSKLVAKPRLKLGSRLQKLIRVQANQDTVIQGTEAKSRTKSSQNLDFRIYRNTSLACSPHINSSLRQILKEGQPIYTPQRITSHSYKGSSRQFFPKDNDELANSSHHTMFKKDSPLKIWTHGREGGCGQILLAPPHLE